MTLAPKPKKADSLEFYKRRRPYERLIPGLTVMLAVFAIMVLARFSVYALMAFVAIALLAIPAVAYQLFLAAFEHSEYPACPVCGESGGRLVWVKDDLAMMQCSECGLMMASPRFATFRRFVLTQFWGWKDIRDIARCSRLLGRDNLRDNILPKLETLKANGFHGKGMSLIDVGCGPGAFLKAARESGFEVLGLEPAWLPTFWARRKLGLDVRAIKLELFRPARLFDVVVCLHVIEHMPDPLSAMRRMSEICKPDGIILLATPNLGCQKAREMGVDWEAVGPADHLFLFDEKSLRMLIEKSKLEIIDFKDGGEELTALCRHN